MQHTRTLENLIQQRLFRLDRLNITGIDNEKVAKIFSNDMLDQEICLFANSISNGDEYCELLHSRILNALQKKEALAIVRFADGEYAFYNYTLGCNGLYKQAESVDAIRKVMPQHIEALKYLETNGLLAPLIFPGNSSLPEQKLFPFSRSQKDSSGADFLDFLFASGIHLRPENYMPFYAVYAYLISDQFASAVGNKKICVLNSEYHEKPFHNWFSERSCSPQISYVPIPAEYVATQWEKTKKETLAKIPPDTDICLAGAGVGALLICRDVAAHLSVPVIDAGHVLNMMNGRVDKSNGVRLYTLRKQT